MRKWPRPSDEARYPFRVIADFRATLLNGNEDAFNRDEHFQEPPTTIEVGQHVFAFTNPVPYLGQEVVIFTRGDIEIFFVANGIFSRSTQPALIP